MAALELFRLAFSQAQALDLAHLYSLQARLALSCSKWLLHANVKPVRHS